MNRLFGNLRAVFPQTHLITLSLFSCISINKYTYYPSYAFFQSHTMRVAVCEVLGEILVRVLCGDGLDESGKADRDRFFDTLQEHLHDVHSHVRARVLQVYARIVNSKVGPWYCDVFLNSHC